MTSGEKVELVAILARANQGFANMDLDIARVFGLWQPNSTHGLFSNGDVKLV